MTRVPEEQWALPVSYSTDGAQMVTLRQYFNQEIAAIPISNLSVSQRIEIATKRIQIRPGFEMATINHGLIEKDKAIAEIRAQSALGRNLLEIEQKAIGFLLEAIEDETKIQAREK